MDIFDNLGEYFSPFMSKKYCLYFYILSIFTGVIFVLTVLTGAISLIKNYKKLNNVLLLNWVVLMANLFLAYFVNRLLYSMCYNSLY